MKLYMQARAEICSRYNKEYSLDLHTQTAGFLAIEASNHIVSTLNLPVSAEEFNNESKKLYKSIFPSATLKPGADRLIRHFHSHGVPIAVATSSSRQHVELKFTNHKSLFSLMHHLVSGTSDSEVKHGKPAPDIFLICASKFPDKPPPEKVLVFEDAPNGVLAAVAAGMQVVMVPEDHIPPEKRAAATLVISSLEKFRPEIFGLPPFEVKPVTKEKPESRAQESVSESSQGSNRHPDKQSSSSQSNSSVSQDRAKEEAQ